MHKGTKNTNWLNGKITELLILVAALAFAAPRQAQAYVYFFTNNDFSQGTLQHWNTGPLGDFPIPYWVHDAGLLMGPVSTWWSRPWTTALKPGRTSPAPQLRLPTKDILIKEALTGKTMMGLT